MRLEFEDTGADLRLGNVGYKGMCWIWGFRPLNVKSTCLSSHKTVEGGPLTKKQI